MHREYHPEFEPRKRRPIRWWTLLPWLLLAYMATGIYTVGPDEIAVVRRFGRVLPQHRGPGLHFGLPYGFDRVDRLRPLERKREDVGMAESGGADSQTAQSTGRVVLPQHGEYLTGDRNLILVSAAVQYRISDPDAYLLGATDVPALIRASADNALTTAITSMRVDDIWTVGRISIQNSVKEAAQQALSSYGVGVTIESISLKKVLAPAEVKEAFDDVTAAREDAQRTKNEAEAYAKRVLPEVRGQAQRMRVDAEGDAAAVVNTAQGEADRFDKIRAELASGRELTVKRLILETMEEVLPRLNKIVVDGDSAEQLDLGIFEEPR